MPPKTVPIHGNYHGYYSKRVTDAEGDVRLALLPPDLFADKRVLDVGCNEGWVTCEIAQTRHAREVVGVDIDPELVSLAWKRRKLLWSTQAPIRSGKRKRDTDEPELASLDPHYFPAAMHHIFGPLSVPPARTEDEKTRFPHNVAFVSADWVNNGCPAFDAQGYDVVLALSVTKWIHLNDGDEGIRAFFTRVLAALREGGTFVLEIQPWDSYAKARRMHPKLKENSAKLQLRPDAFGDVLKEVGFIEDEFLGVPGEGGFARPLRMYTKAPLS
ncbi:Bin3-domain-containing protein [Exidia glandulosa HHB12029]|uniref:RNA methyltransferase n=1 Tax=Exidia glandulosa HHB12029 TaxID=1314781 RepID=A0A165KU12_EXIGL|nr:Bin3-domain-containing protein [Exidia glandulosa HHB12029]